MLAPAIVSAAHPTPGDPIGKLCRIPSALDGVTSVPQPAALHEGPGAAGRQLFIPTPLPCRQTSDLSLSKVLGKTGFYLLPA